MAQNNILQGLLAEDDAYRFFIQCPVESLKPEYGENGLPELPDSFTLEEIEAVFAGFSQNQ